MCAMRVARVSTIRVIVNGMVMIGMTVRVALGSVRNVARAFSRLVVASSAHIGNAPNMVRITRNFT